MALRVLDRTGLGAAGSTHGRSRVLDRRPSSLVQVLEHLDVLLVVSTVVLAALGVLMVYSATRTKLAVAGVDPHYYLKRQAAYAAIGLVVMVVVTLFDYHRLEEWAYAVFGVVVVGLLGVMTPFGHRSLGGERWFQVGSFQLQPSSFATVAMIAAVAVYCSRHRGELDLRRVSKLVVAVGVPILLVIKEPDLGTGIIMGVVLMAMMIVAGTRARFLALLVALGALAMFAVVHFGALKQYQLDRLSVFLQQGSHQQASQARGAAYNLIQSEAALANGKLTGTGLFKGPETNLAYVPEQQTDFIFTAVGEQLGFAGTTTVLVLFSIMAWRMLRAAQLARDHLGQLLCAGPLALIAFSVFQNAGMTMGIMPITGVPLPFLSYGGSSTIAFFAAVGLVLNVGMRRLR